MQKVDDFSENMYSSLHVLPASNLAENVGRRKEEKDRYEIWGYRWAEMYPTDSVIARSCTQLKDAMPCGIEHVRASGRGCGLDG